MSRILRLHRSRFSRGLEICHGPMARCSSHDHRRRGSKKQLSYRIETTSSGWGIMAQQTWLAGETVLSAGTATVLYTRKQPDSHTLQIGPQLHAVLGLPARFLNHSCNANLVVAGAPSFHALRFVAKRDIAVGEELTFDYETTEGTMDEPFQCECGETSCRGMILGFDHRRKEMLEGGTKRWIAPHLI